MKKKLRVLNMKMRQMFGYVSIVILLLAFETGFVLASEEVYSPTDDIKGTAGEVALAPYVPPAGTVTVLVEGFELSFPGSWSVGDDNASGTNAYWDDVTSTFGGEAPHGGAWKGYCADIGNAGDFANPLYQNNMSAYMKRNIDLTDANSATLSFWYMIPDIDSGWDDFNVYIGTNKVYTRSSEQASWTKVTINLTAYVGSSPELKFEFDSDFVETAEGVYLDDILVTKLSQPDLTASINANPEPLQWGDAFSAAIKVNNIGTASAGVSTAKIYISANSTITSLDHYLGTINVGTIVAGSYRSYPQSLTLPSTPPSGFTLNDNIYIGIVVDANNNVAEFSENNNTKYDYVVVSAGWDLGYAALGGGWRNLLWLGHYAPLASDWAYHAQHDYMYIYPSSTPENIFFYTDDMGWFWTKSTMYPYMYRFNDGAWLWYLKGSDNPRQFSNITTGQWEQH